MLRLDGYVRVSRVGGREGEGYISPAVQREAVEGYAAELRGEIIAWHDDQDFSGGNIERPGFQAALQRLRAGETDGIIVMRIDRFARSVADGATIVREIIDAGQIFASVHERIDPRTPEGKYMLTSFLANAELFLDQAKASWWTAKSRAIARGAHIGPTPVGYLKVEPRPTKDTHISPADSAAIGGPTSPGVLVPSPIYGDAITELFVRAASGRHGDSALANWMTERAPRAGGAQWQSSEIRRWLSSRVYLGEVRYGELVNADAHEPLTDLATWERCQREPGRRRRAASPFLLSGLVRCAHCRYAMAGFNYGGARHDTPVYRCSRGRTRGCGEPPVIVASRLDALVRDLVLERLRGLRLEAADAGIDIDAIDRELAEAEAELNTFATDLQARRLLGEAGWQAGLQVRVVDRDAKQAQRDEVYARGQLAAVAHHVEDLDHDGLRDLLGGMIRHVFVRRRARGADVAERALVIWSDDPRVIDVPGPHRSGRFEPVRW